MDPRGNMESAALTKDGLAYLTNQVEDFTYQLRYWPPYYKDMLMCNHLYYTGRFQLTIFLLGNRLSPITIAEWYLGRNQLKNAAAKEHVAELFRGHMQGKLEKYKVYVMQATKSNGDAPSEFVFRNGDIIVRGEDQPLVTPDFAKQNRATTGIANDWDLAIALMLK